MSQLDKAIRKQMHSVAAEISSSLNPENERLTLLKKNIGRVVGIPLDEIHLDENVRQEIDVASSEFRKLIESIREYGILQSIVVEIREDQSQFKLVCVAGHRRILAAKELNISRVQCLVQQFDERAKKVGAALAENLNRENLHCIDVAEGYADLMRAGWSEDRLAIQFERDRKTIKRYLKIASWSDQIKNLMRQHKEKFTSRVILQEFAQLSFQNDEALLAAVNAKIKNDTPRNDSRRSVAIQKKLDRYFAERREISPETKQFLLTFLRDLNIIP